MWQKKFFVYGIILLLFFSVVTFGSVDLWAQTVIHLGTIFLLLFYFFISSRGFALRVSVRRVITSKEIVSIPPGLIILFLCLTFSYFFSYSKFTSREEFFNWLNYFIFFLFALLFSEEKKLFCQGIIGIAVFLVLKGIFDYFFSGIYPLKASLLNPNIFAGYLIMVIPLTIGQISKFKIQSFDKLRIDPEQSRMGQNSKLRMNNRTSLSVISYQLSAILLLVGLILTGSLGAILSLFLAFLLFFRPRRGFFLVLILVFILLLIFKFSQPEVSNRLLWWQGALKMFLSRPLTGIGLGNFARYYPQFKTQGLSSLYAHNYYLQILAENGVFVLLSLFSVLIYFFRSARPSDKQREKNFAIYTGITALLIHNFIDYNLAIPGVALTFWTLLGLEMKPGPDWCRINLKGKKYFLVVLTILLLIFSYYPIKFFLANRSYARGLYYFNNEKNLPKAERELLTSLKLDPQYTPTYQVLSSVYTQYFFQDKSIEYLKSALSFIEQATRKEKNYAPYWLDKAWVHYLFGDKGATRAALERAKKLGIPSYLTANLEKLL